MYLLGYSLNNLSLMALTISTGFVVDDAIVMIENIARYIEEGDAPLEAALKGAEQIGFTIMSLTVSLIAVLIPLLFMGDIVGRLFREFAVTLGVDDPDLGGRLADADADDVRAAAAAQARGASRGRFYRVSERAFDGIIADYGRTLQWVLRHQRDAARRGRHAGPHDRAVHPRPEGLLPRAGHGRDPGHLRRRRRTSPSRRWRSGQQALAQVILRGPGRGEPLVVHRRGRHQHHPQQRADPDQPEAPGGAQGTAPPRSSAACSRSWRQVEGITLYLQPVQDLTVEDRVSRTQYQYTLEDPDARSWTPGRRSWSTRCRRCPELATWRAISRTRACRPRSTIDRAPRPRLGITPADDRRHALRRLRPAAGLHDVHAAEPVPRRARGQARIPAAPRRTAGTSTSAAPAGGQVPLSAFTRICETTAPLVVNHQGQFPAVTLSFNLAPGVSLGRR